MKPNTLITFVALAATSTSHIEAFAPPLSLPATETRTPSLHLRQPLHLNLQQDFNNEESLNETWNNKSSTQPTPVLFSAGKNIMESVKHPKAVMAAAFLVTSLLLNPAPSEAAMSGGRIGGSYASRPSVSRTRMASPARRSSSYSNSGGGGGFGRGFATGYGAGVLSAPRVSYGYSPFYSPGYYGAPGVITYNRGPSLLPLLLVGGLAYTAFNAVGTTVSSTIDSIDDGMPSFLRQGEASPLGYGTSVVQLSVALEVPNRDDPNSILSALDRLARTARTDSRVGIQNLTSQVALELLRRKSSIVSASTSSKKFSDPQAAMRNFSQKSVQERGKFERESMSNYGGVDYATSQSKNKVSPNSPQATMAVVTLVLNIDGDSTGVSSINSVQDVEKALRNIASDTKVDDCLQAAEILWTPEDRTETLTSRDVLMDYPELRSI